MSLLSHGISVISRVTKTLSLGPGVYRMLGEKGEILYIGKAKNLKKRVVSYTYTSKLPVRLQRMVAQTRSMEIVTTHSETEALLLESNLIKKLKPKYNILLRDDKSFPYIVIYRGHPYPRLTKYRGKREGRHNYYGPFASGAAADETLEVLYKVFKLRSCTDSFFATRRRPCLQYYIKRCSGPCVGHISQEDYAQDISNAKAFLEGKSSELQQTIAEKMQQASQLQDYEKAAMYRDQIKLLSKVQTRQRINISNLRNVDVIGLKTMGNDTCVQVFFYRDGHNYGTHSFFLDHTSGYDLNEQISSFLMQFYETLPPPPLLLLSHEPSEKNLIISALQERFDAHVKIEVPQIGFKKDLIDYALTNAKDTLERRLAQQGNFKKTLVTIGELFAMKAPPKRIEVYDNSHLQGTNPYGVMIVVNEEGFDKKSYRKFSIKDQPLNAPQGGDDYAMMREVMLRRFARLKANEEDVGWQKPELILIDGGKGQLNAVAQILEQLEIEGVTLVGIAKGPDRNAGEEKFFMLNEDSFSLPKNDPRLYFLQRLRDESHRFAIGTHRAGREKNLKKSILDEIPSIGSYRKRALLQHFGSAQAVKNASLVDLLNVKGINKEIAKKIYNYFHNL